MDVILKDPRFSWYARVSCVHQTVPKVSYWSDIVWAQWIETADAYGKPKDSLLYVFRDNVETANTKYIMEQVVDPTLAHGALHAPWPGKELLMNTPDGQALLGTPHGNGIVQMLNDHRQHTKKKIQKVTLFTVGQKYYLLFTLTRGK